MGTVYLAEDTALKRRVALKFVRQETVGNREATVRLLREARAASALDHPHIATVYEIGDHGDQPFIAMAYYEGETLAARLAGAQMTLPEVARIVAQMADALHAAHAAGIVHRDVKPPNVMLTTAGQVKVLDFGLAKVQTGEMATQLTLAGETVGTAAYMSPEQAAGEAADARSDLWSLGVVTYEMLTGARPFTGTNALGVLQAVLAASPAPVRTLRPDIAPELEAIVTRTLVRDRERRSITADGVRDLAAGCHARLLSPRSAVVAAPPASRRTRIAAAVVALAVAAGGIAWWAERNAKVRWARQEALPEIIRLAGADEFDDAYRLAQQAQPYIPDDLLLAEQLRNISRVATIDSDPAGADVFYRPYGRTAEAWRPLGRTPVTARVPRGLLHWKAEMAGREAAEDVGPGPFSRDFRLRFPLYTGNHVPAGMVRIASSGVRFRIHTTGYEQLPDVQVPDYWIDRHEVTNRAFKRFVDDGGYRRAELWQEPILRDGRALSVEAAMAHFRDATGRPGPAQWEMGAYRAGQGDFPEAA
ncbi:MAG: protein kinase [Acidobacteria bacterium]|nr:protein kinase [Acidobacteriota bacterium]